MAEKTSYVPLTAETAKYVEIKKVATVDIVATNHHSTYAEGAVLQENVDIYIAVRPEEPCMIKDAVGAMEHYNRHEEYEGYMRTNADLKEHDQCWDTEKICAESIESIFTRIKSTNEIATAGGFVDMDKNTSITVITERL